MSESNLCGQACDGLKSAAKKFPAVDGRYPHVSAVWRACRKGLLARSGRRIRLEHKRVGRRIVIPNGAVERFLEELAREDLNHFDAPAAPPATAPEPATPALRAKQIAAAEAACKKRGI